MSYACEHINTLVVQGASRKGGGVRGFVMPENKVHLITSTNEVEGDYAFACVFVCM